MPHITKTIGSVLAKHTTLVVRILLFVIALYELFLVYQFIARPLFFPSPVETAAVSARQPRQNEPLYTTVIEQKKEKESHDIRYTDVRDPFGI